MHSCSSGHSRQGGVQASRHLPAATVGLLLLWPGCNSLPLSVAYCGLVSPADECTVSEPGAAQEQGAQLAAQQEDVQQQRRVLQVQEAELQQRHQQLQALRQSLRQLEVHHAGCTSVISFDGCCWHAACSSKRLECGHQMSRQLLCCSEPEP